MELNIIEHEFVSDPGQDHAYSYCKHCNSVLGINLGTECVSKCNERFNEKQFQSWLDFRNYSKMNNGNYIKRFTNDIISRKQILRKYTKTIKL